jgi:hypothetical protein
VGQASGLPFDLYLCQDLRTMPADYGAHEAKRAGKENL